MAPYSIEKVYGDINTIDGYFYEMKDGSEFTHGSIRNYCPYRESNPKGLGTCMNYFQMARSGVIHLLENLEKYNLEYEKLAEYAILFLSYKLKQHSQHKYKCANLNNFYTDHIEKNNDYNKKIKDNGSSTYKEIIDKKKDLMNTNEISKFNGPFSILVLLYNEIKKNKSNCEKCSKKANEFVQSFEKLNDDSNINGNASYRKLLFTLSDDYNNLKNKCTDFPPLPKIKTPLTKLIPVLSTIPVIPVFLGIAYKYSLFGIDKLFQRQYIRKKLKKVKKELKLNI
ncbi:CIR protein PIR protein [Plasmodium vinckei brucechwatti]|uniref:CIR protein PIR protein n=1 Tax=Plasmodium vinckei brucechwatti TaxID=119398 RepID=A0A6V7SFZ9_PLAVN|nr:CIR protein PIR protein [Plasmodium vinckei brucechwatti]